MPLEDRLAEFRAKGRCNRCGTAATAGPGAGSPDGGRTWTHSDCLMSLGALIKDLAARVKALEEREERRLQDEEDRAGVV